MSEKMIEHNLELIERLGKKDIAIKERVKMCGHLLDHVKSDVAQELLRQEIEALTRILNI